MKNIILLLPLLFLAACTPEKQYIIKERITVVDIPNSLFVCPELKNYPNIAKLTNADISKVLFTLAKNNKQCANSMRVIKSYILEAKKKLETEQNDDNGK